MATQVKPGGITKGIRHLEKDDWQPTIHLDMNQNGKPFVSVVEHGDVRLLPISKAVAEVLIANGMRPGDYGS